MTLSRLLSKKRLVVLGLNSGTSADGLDMALLQIDRSRGAYGLRQFSGGMHKYPRPLRQAILAMADVRTVSPDEIIYLDQALGQFFGRMAAAYVERLRRAGVVVDMIASHGQTVRHCPQKMDFAGCRVNGTMQLGSLEQIAAHTGKIVVGDFRQADIALGNEGAPITVAAMERLFAVPSESRLIVNIGGMANFFYFPSRRSPMLTAAADCGPGNSLSDILTERLFGRPFDRGGKLAMSGEVSQRLLTLLLAEPFFRDVVLSTGREAFGQELADRVIAHARKLRLVKQGIIATVAELTVVAIGHSVRRIVRRDATLRSLYLTGGGVRNTFIRHRLGRQFPGLEVVTVAALGFDPDLVEACAYAVMGEAALRSEAMITRCGGSTGRKQKPVPGRIVQPPREG